LFTCQRCGRNVGLSIRKLEAIEGKEAESAMETKEVLKGTIAEAVNGVL
jgi:hypothetical protein